MYPVSQRFLNEMKAGIRKVSARCVIDYTDPFIDQSITATVNERANVSYPQQTADNVEETPHKWAALDGTWDITTGEYHLAPSPERAPVQQFGWWGAQFSGVGGVFSLPYPELTVTHVSRPVHIFRVVGDSARGEYPVDFTIRLYSSTNTLLHTENVIGNTEVNWFKIPTEPVLDVAKQVLTISKWSHEGRCAKIVEFFTSISETYEVGDLVSVRFLEEREVSQGSLPIGNISSNEVTVVLNNENRKFDLDNEASPLKNLLKPNRRIRVWLGSEIPITWIRISDKTWGELKGGTP